MPQKKTKVIREIPENPFIQGQAKRKKLRVAAYLSLIHISEPTRPY